MKRRIFILLFVLLTNFIQAATIYIYVHNVNGNLVSNSYVKFYNNNWNLIGTGYTNGSGMVEFYGLDYGNYNYEVYYTGDAQEYWGSEENISLQNPTLTSNFTRYWPYRYSYNTPPSSVNTNSPVTFDITVKNNVSFSRNAKVEIWVDRNQSSSWDFHQLSSYQSISSNGTKTYSFTFTPTSSGTYYWKMHVLTYNDGTGDYIVTDSYSWTNAFTAIDPEGDLDIYVKNVNGNYVENAYVILYDEYWNFEDDDYTNSSGRADFNNLDYGLYHYEVFYTGDVQEFWGGDENINVNSSSETETFTRNWPFRYSYNEPPTTIDLYSQATYEVTVKNNLSFSRNVKVELWVDRDQSSSWDFHQTSSYQSISSNGTKTYNFDFTPTVSGTYYWKMHVLSYNDGAGDYIVTDSYSWLFSFEAVNNQPFPLNVGAIIFHNYSDYDAWDAKLFMYDFTNNTKTELSTNWNIDHEMNAHISPDGSKIVFMGDDSGEPRHWDIYIWDIGSNNAPTNLTSSNNMRDEDPKFSPDGNSIVFKQEGDIKVMNLSGTITNEITNDGYTIEESMPYYKSNGQEIIYAKGAGANSDIYSINIDGSNNTALFDVSGVTEYYPILKNNSSFFYSRWISSSNHNDQIYLGDFYGNSSSLSINDLTSNNSDAYPVNSDYLFFSSTRSGGMGGYDLYFGQISSGDIWNLNDYSINSTLEDLGACYTPQITFNIYASANPINSGTVSGTGSYEYGETANLIATEETGYDFVNWTENGTQVSTNANYNFTVTGSRTLVANFEIQTYTISASANPNNGGTVSGDGNYNYGETANMTATEETGYDFVNWTENGTQVSTDANYSFTVTESRTLVANFEIQSFTISTSANPSNGGTVSGAGSYEYGETANLIATEETGYDFVNWTENGTQVSTDANYSFTVTENRTLVANFEIQTFDISASANPNNGGTVSGGGNYNFGETANMTATEETGYDFVNWTENGTQVSTDAGYSFTVIENRTLVANFTNQDYIISASANPENGGSTSGAGGYDYGDIADLIATAATEYDFINWTENGTEVSTDENYSFTVTESRTLIANFESTVNVFEINEDKLINVYPNPSTGKITIEGKNISLIKVININGQVIKQLKAEPYETTIDLNNEAKGIYTLKLVVKDKIISKKVLIK